MGIELLDQHNTSILKVGYYDEPNNASYKYHSDIVLADDERIVGFKSGKRGNTHGFHYDFQFIIGRMA